MRTTTTSKRRPGWAEKQVDQCAIETKLGIPMIERSEAMKLLTAEHRHALKVVAQLEKKWSATPRELLAMKDYQVGIYDGRLDALADVKAAMQRGRT